MLGDRQDDGVGGEERDAIAELIGGGEQAELVIVAGRFDAPGIDHDVWVAAASAVRKAKQVSARRPFLRPTAAMPIRPRPTAICASAIQLRRRPSLVKIGALTRSMIGAQMGLSE